jgi:hypothetical protein
VLLLEPISVVLPRTHEKEIIPLPPREPVFAVSVCPSRAAPFIVTVPSREDGPLGSEQEAKINAVITKAMADNRSFSKTSVFEKTPLVFNRLIIFIKITSFQNILTITKSL